MTVNDAGLLTAEQAAELLGVTENWVYLAARKRQLESVRVGGLVRFRPEVIEEYIEDHTQTAA